MKKRIFVACMISPKLQEAIQRWRMKYLQLPVKWVESEELHITLIPPWYENDIQKIITTLQSIPNVSIPLTVQFKEISFGPQLGDPDLIWMQAEASDAWDNFKIFLQEILERKSEKQALAHITLARFAKNNFVKLRKEPIMQSINWKEYITSFTLLESYMNKNISYKTLIKIPLKK